MYSVIEVQRLASKAVPMNQPPRVGSGVVSAGIFEIVTI